LKRHLGKYIAIICFDFLSFWKSLAMAFKHVFVTVGTTEFTPLVHHVCSPEIGQVLKRHGCTSLTIQHGRGAEPDFSQLPDGITTTSFDLKSSITEDISSADLVISHAGAGSCIEVLRAKKPLIVVINETLMDNHQLELAEKLQAENYLVYTTVEGLAQQLSVIGEHEFRDYEPGHVKEFVQRLDQLMGF
jgi:beta-1,4-N-acetylglucosaminyltransferase